MAFECYIPIIFQGLDTGGTDFNTRLVCIEKEIISPRHEKIKMGHLDKTKEPFSVRAKQFWDLGQAKAVSFTKTRLVGYESPHLLKFLKITSVLSP